MELLLSHHGPGQHDRCLRLGRWLVCRRCLLLWPLCYALIALQVALRVPAPHPLDLLIPALLVAPAVEFIEVQRGTRPYSAARVWLLTPLLAIGLARLLFRYMVHPGDPVNWAVLALLSLPCAWAVISSPARAPRAGRVPGDR